MVHAAGNDGAGSRQGQELPDADRTSTADSPQHWIEVGASSWKGGDRPRRAASRTTAQKQVDVFAPGVDILSTVPGNQYERDSGTSMAAPVVSGLAALIMDYYPNLTGADVKKIIIASVSQAPDQMVIEAGQRRQDKVPFGTLSVTGGIVNAYNALKMAEEMSNGRRDPVRHGVVRRSGRTA